MEENNVKIYVVMYNPDDRVKAIPYPYYIPIQAGKAIYNDNKKGFLPELGDNTGDNISELNPYFSELTAMYWVWKNDKSKPNDIVGINHYRRYFAENTDFDINHGLPEAERFKYLLTKETINQYLNEYDFIVRDLKMINYSGNNFSTYDLYNVMHIIEDLDFALEGIQKLYPHLFPCMEYQIKQTNLLCSNNMIITRKKLFDEYCEFLFSILFYVKQHIDITDKEHNSIVQKRVFGYLSERLLGSWIIASNYSGLICNYLHLDDEENEVTNDIIYINF